MILRIIIQPTKMSALITRTQVTPVKDVRNGIIRPGFIAVITAAVADKPDVNLFVEWAILAHYYSLDGNSPLKNYRAETYRFFDFAAKHNVAVQVFTCEEQEIFIPSAKTEQEEK